MSLAMRTHWKMPKDLELAKGILLALVTMRNFGFYHHTTLDDLKETLTGS